ncbi:putative protein SEC13 -like protein [Capsicum annuum]|nr:putative protein SEC13 -like protein [Capsicum annuum]
MPTTLSSGVALTRLAGGNSALALAMTLMSNLLGILIVPFSISKLIAAGVGVCVPAGQLFRSLVLTLLVPLIIGKGLRECFKAVYAMGVDFPFPYKDSWRVCEKIINVITRVKRTRRGKDLLSLSKPSDMHSLRLFTSVARSLQNVAAPVSNPPKIHYVWRIRYVPVNIFEELEQHSF